MRLLHLLFLFVLPAAAAEPDCGRLAENDTYSKLNEILECLESKISELQKKAAILGDTNLKGSSIEEHSMTGEEVENNNQVTGANLIELGQRVRGTLAKPDDRDFYKFRTSSKTDKFRVIVRKLSASGFWADVNIFDEAETLVSDSYARWDAPVSMQVESRPNSFYFVSIKSRTGDRGDYELEVREER